MFSDEQFLSATEKEAILADWRAFLRSGFEEAAFSPALYKFLTLYSGHYAHFDREQFCTDFFASNGAALAAFLLQFSNEPGEVAIVPAHWRTGPGADLNDALCAEMALIFNTLQDALIAFAAETYQTEKWAELADRLGEIDHATSEDAAHLSAIYDLTFPFELYLNHFDVTPALRHKLAEAVAALTDRAAQPLSLFAVRRHLDAESRAVTRQAEVVPGQVADFLTAPSREAAIAAAVTAEATPEPAFTADETERRRIRLSEARTLAQRIARLTATEAELPGRYNRPAEIALGGAK